MKIVISIITIILFVLGVYWIYKYFNVIDKSQFLSNLITGILLVVLFSFLAPFFYEKLTSPKDVIIFFQNTDPVDTIKIKVPANTKQITPLIMAMEHKGGYLGLIGKPLLNPVYYTYLVPNELELQETYEKTAFGVQLIRKILNDRPLYPQRAISSDILTVAIPPVAKKYTIYYMVDTEFGPYPKSAKLKNDRSKETIETIKDKWNKLFVDVEIESQK